MEHCTILNDNLETCFLNVKKGNRQLVIGTVYQALTGDYHDLSII